MSATSQALRSNMAGFIAKYWVFSLLTSLHLAVSAPITSYDYVVCGGGTAGTALAVRLAQGSNSTVLLIEAGPYPSVEPSLSIPAESLANAGGLTDWNFTTVAANGIPELNYTRGKVLGGSSQYNYMVYTRGPSVYYDHIAEYLDDDTWSWNSSYKYFQRSLNVTPPIGYVANDVPQIYNAQGGPLQVDYQLPTPNITRIVGSSYENVLGLDHIDYNDGMVIGYEAQGLTVSAKTGRRSSSWESFGELGQALPNFHVLTHCMVLKVNFVPGSGLKTVASVSYLDTLSNTTRCVRVKKEAILSGGFIQSPQMLQLSGIGPRDVLEGIKVPLVIDLPAVGQNFQDHVLISAESRMLDNVQTASKLLASVSISDLEIHGPHSPYATLLGSQIGWQHLQDNNSIVPSTEWPNAEWILTGPVNPKKLDPENQVMNTIVLLAPTSRGNVSLVSNNALDKPMLNTNYLSTSEDQKYAVILYRHLQDLIHSPPYSNYLAADSPPWNASQSDEEILHKIQQTVNILYHGCCTVAAGPNASTGAVNSKFVVHGTKNLRVVDLSVLPKIVPAHTQAIAYMMAEKAAVDILQGVVE